jgi:hypothetical protein
MRGEQPSRGEHQEPVDRPPERPASRTIVRAIRECEKRPYAPLSRMKSRVGRWSLVRTLNARSVTHSVRDGRWKRTVSSGRGIPSTVTSSTAPDQGTPGASTSGSGRG